MCADAGLARELEKLNRRIGALLDKTELRRPAEYKGGPPLAIQSFSAVSGKAVRIPPGSWIEVSGNAPTNFTLRFSAAGDTSYEMPVRIGDVFPAPPDGALYVESEGTLSGTLTLIFWPPEAGYVRAMTAGAARTADKLVNGKMELLASGTDTATATGNISSLIDVSAYHTLYFTYFITSRSTPGSPALAARIISYDANQNVISSTLSTEPYASLSAPDANGVIKLATGAEIGAGSAVAAANFAVTYVPGPVSRYARILAEKTAISALSAPWELYGSRR